MLRLLIAFALIVPLSGCLATPRLFPTRYKVEEEKPVKKTEEVKKENPPENQHENPPAKAASDDEGI